jgi:hypothetical protein
MTARELLGALEPLGVRLTPAPDGRLAYVATPGALTLVLQGVLKTCKKPLWTLLTTGEDSELPKNVSLPATDFSQFRTWQTGTVPANGRLIATALDAPTYHDTPSEPRTYVGKPCPKKVCKPTTTFKDGKPASVYFAPSGICVACWERWDKQTTEEEEPPRTTLGPFFEL